MLPSLQNQGVRVFERANQSPTYGGDLLGSFLRVSSGGDSTSYRGSPPPPNRRRLTSRLSPVPVFREFRERGRLLPWLWVLALLVILAAGVFAARTYLGGNVRSLQDELMEAKESLLQNQDRVAALEADLSKERKALQRSEALLTQARGLFEGAQKERHQLQAAVGDLKATSEETTSKLEVRVRELEASLKDAETEGRKMSSNLQKAHDQGNTAVGAKDEMLQAYHETMVRQRTDIEAKTALISRLHNEVVALKTMLHKPPNASHPHHLPS
mmetsp:Transcript_63206/g.151209  ORF Transcript_63206/g.151209 Transcript_63206/m.151209 type:complete len:271 (-) Transcript_63206:349-1161(-)